MKKITIGVPTRNRCEYVVRAVRSALAQTYSDIEVIASDNASTDDTARRLQEFDDPRLKLIVQPTNIGLAGNFNTCLNAATGDGFLMLSDDDILAPDAIERLSEPFRHPPDGIAADSIGLSWCPCTVVNSAGQPMWTTDGGQPLESPVALLESLFRGNYGPRFCSILIRTQDAKRVGGYDETRYGPICDLGNWAQVAVQYPYVVGVREPLASYTVHQKSETSKSGCAEWRQYGENIFQDVAKILRGQGDRDGERRLRAANKCHLTNLMATIMLQHVGRPGWIGYLSREVVRAPQYLLTPFMARRLLRDGWKLLRLRAKT